MSVCSSGWGESDGKVFLIKIEKGEFLVMIAYAGVCAITSVKRGNSQLQLILFFPMMMQPEKRISMGVWMGNLRP